MKMHYFTYKNIGRIYAKGRPYVHDQVAQQARAFLNLTRPVPRALDIGCGTGLSTVALEDIAHRIVALDISYDMVATAPRKGRTSYINAAAENVPLAATSFDLVTVSSAFHWFDKERFRKELNRVLKPGAWAIIYENHFTAQLMECPEFKQWFCDVFLRRYPAPSRDFTLDRTKFKDAGILFLGEESCEKSVSFTSEQLIIYLLSITNVISVVESGHVTCDDVASWLRTEMKQFSALCPAGEASGNFMFAGSIQYFQKQV